MQSVTRNVNNTGLQLFIFCLTWATKKIECQELKEQKDNYPNAPVTQIGLMYIGLLGAHFASPKFNSCNQQNNI
jgi:hypothetical protein